MSSTPFKPKLPAVAESELTPLVRTLLHVIAEQQEEIQRLHDELRRVQELSPRPQLKPNTLEPVTAVAGKEEADAPDEARRRRGPQRAKTAELVIHDTQIVPLHPVPPGARYKGHVRYVVQDLIIRPHNTCYCLEQWQLPTGEYATASPPVGVRGGHYGPQLVSFVLDQYYDAHVTHPTLLHQLRDHGVQISAGQLSHLLTQDHEPFHQEKAEIKIAGFAVSTYFQADDTGARHKGRNGYTTYIGNDLFAWFGSTDSKSRINFLELLQTERCYAINEAALQYVAARGLATGHQDLLRARPVVVHTAEAWATHLRQILIHSPRAVTLATEGALMGGLAVQGFNFNIGLISDDAGQFDLFVHALCWVHGERPLRHLLPLDEGDRRAIGWVRQQIWCLYRDLKAYRRDPTPAAKQVITAGFEALCATETTCKPLNAVLERLRRNQAELLRVLERPDLPLHNNRAENDLRDVVKKRKISAGTRSEAGRTCRDTFASLKKTCRKLGLSFWTYLNDRVSGQHAIAPLGDLIRQTALRLSPPPPVAPADTS